MKKRLIFIVFTLLICMVTVLSVAGAESDRLYDEADLLTDVEEEVISERLDSVTEEFGVELVVATVSSTGDYTATEYCEAYYDEGEYGIGEDRSGILLFIAMEDEEGGRSYRIHARGFAEEALTEDEQISIGETVATFLSAEDYSTAINTFIDECEYQINGEINGFPFKFVRNLIISLVIGFVIALIVTGIWKGQLKSVRQQSGAATYTKDGSMQVETANDFFLYRTITRQKKEEKSSQSSSGSSGGRTTGGSF